MFRVGGSIQRGGEGCCHRLQGGLYWLKSFLPFESADLLLQDSSFLHASSQTHMTPRTTPQAMGSPCIDRNYYKCWTGLQKHFKPPV